MQKNRAFTLADVNNYAISRGYEIQHQRYKRVFTLRDVSNPRAWSWVYFPHAPETLIGLVNDLNLDGWKIAIDKTIDKIEARTLFY